MSQIIPTLHLFNAFLILLAALIAGVWGLILYFRKREMIKPWRIMLIVVLVLGLLQGLFGVTMVLMGLKPGGGTGLYYLHYVYGGIVALGIPFVWLKLHLGRKESAARGPVL